MTVGRRTLSTSIERSIAVLQDPPGYWSYSALKEVEACALRYSLARASYPDLWEGHGYPPAPSPSALFGDVVHDALEQVVRALVAAGCTSSVLPEAVAVLRGVGGYSGVVTAALERRLSALQGNPRLSAVRREQIQRQLENRVPEARGEVQSRLGRMTLVPRPSRSAYMDAPPLSRERARRALGPGTYAEVSLQADEIQIMGRLDLLNLTIDRADIIDHKTGLEDPTHLDQLRFYGVLWENDLVANASRTPLGELTVAYPNGDLTIDAPEPSELADISESIKARVREAGERVGTDVPVATTGAHCLRCPVRSLCDTYWATMLQDPSAATPGTWFDFEGIVGAQNGAKSWWMLDPSSSEPALLLRTASAQVSLAEGQRLRLVGIRLDADSEVEAVVATLATSSELSVVSGG